MSVNPVGGVDYPATYQQLLRWFPDDQACLDWRSVAQEPFDSHS